MADLESKERQKRINLTDGDARLMKARGSVLLGYNAQAMVSRLEPDGGATGMFITAVDMADDGRDDPQLVPMIEQAEETTGTKSEMTLADAEWTLLGTAFNLRTLWRVWRLGVFADLLRGPKPHFAS